MQNNIDDKAKVNQANDDVNGELAVSSETNAEDKNDDIDSYDQMKFKSVCLRVLQFPLVRHTYDWIISLPYLQTIRLTSLPVLALGSMELDEAGYMKTIVEKTLEVSATVDNAALSFLDVLESKFSYLSPLSNQEN